MKSSRNTNERIKKIILVISVALFSILLTQDYLFTIEPLKKLELKMIDSRFLQRGEIDISKTSDIIILEISQESFDQIPAPYNRWPWPRSVYAKVVENLTDAGVKAIGIDINLSGADQFNSYNDTLLINAIRKSGKVVLAGKIDEVLEKQIEESSTRVKSLNHNFENIFYGADSSIGIVQLPPDYDGVFRRYLPYVYTASVNKKIPSFSFALLNKFYGLPKDFTAIRQSNYFQIDSTKIPQFDLFSMLVNFYGPSGTFQRVKLIDVLDDSEFNTVDEIEFGEQINTWDMDGGLLQSNIFRDKVVLIGSTMPEDRDIFPTSFAKGNFEGDNLIYGVEIHANALQNLISRDFLSRQSKLSEIIEIFLMTLIVFFAAAYSRKIKLKYGFLIEVLNFLFILLIIFAVYLASIYLFVNYNIVIAIISPAVTAFVAYVSSTAFHFIRERQQNVLIKGMFSQYVSTHVVNQLLSDPDKLKLGGEKKNVSILFSDIAGFTTFSESKQPEELVYFINEFLNEMTELILANQGTLDKYLGDAVMAFWGAPVEVDDHAYQACLTALQMQKATNLVSQKWSAAGESPIEIRIGINSGDVIVGNMGGVKRFDYTVMGDNVNLASRLEGANKQYHSKIMISGMTYDLVKDKVLVRDLDLIRVKGKLLPTKVFELLGLADDSDSIAKMSLLENYFIGLKLYREKQFIEAKSHFINCFQNSSDYTSKVYADRCDAYIITPPPDNWDGVYEMKTK
jgi:adenylate cyclase